MNLFFTEPACSGGRVLPSPSPREYHQLRFVMKVSLFYLCLMIASLQLLASAGNSQNLEQLQVTVELNHDNLPTLFHQIQIQTGLTFAFLPDDVASYTDITLPKATRSVKSTLDIVLKGTALRYEQMENNVIVFRGAKEPATVVPVLVRGIVTDVKTQQAIPGVSVMIKGTSRGVTTDQDGKYVLDAQANDILVISFIGYKTIEESVGNRTMIDFTMEEDIKSLQEVVVSGGYYQTLDRLKTGSIVKVTSKEIENQPVTSPMMSLQGRAAGVDVSPNNGVPGSSVKIQIRGQNALRTVWTEEAYDGNLPLYIIDGVQIDSRPLLPAATSLVGQGFDPISSINPANIESIEILKDADATAIYGSRGANGVVLITTKHGVKSEKTNFEVSAYSGAGEISKKLKLLNTPQYLGMRRETFRNDQMAPGTFFPDNDLLTWDTTRYTDWQDELLGGTAKILDAQAIFSGGGARTSFRMGGGIHKETLIFPGDFGYQRASGFISLNHLSLNQKFRATMSVNYGAEKNELFDDGDFMRLALTLPPNAPNLYDDEGNLNWENSTWANPLAALRRTHEATTNNLVSNMTLSYQVLSGLLAKLSLGYTDLDGVEFSKTPLSSYNPAYAMYFTGTSYDGTNKRKSWIVEPQLTYNKNFGDHSIDVVIGSTFQKGDYQSQLIGATGYTSDVLLGNIRAASTVYFLRDENTDYKYMAAFGRIGYNWKQRYLFNVTARRDGSSRFGPNKKFGNFGAVGAAWIFSNEKFLEALAPVISFGKIRASYGTTGNDQILDYRYLDAYILSMWPYQNNVSLIPKSLFNPDFAWEVTKKMEAAIEIGLFNGRFFTEFALYRNQTSNQLVSEPLPYTTGFSSVFKNFDATVRNSGMEITVRTENIRTDNFSWTTSANFSVPRNKLVSFPGIEDSPYAGLYIVGEPTSVSRLYKSKGVDPTSGYYEFVDEDGDGLDNSDKTYIHNYGRVHYGGLSNTFTYKSIELSFLFQYAKQSSPRYSANWPGAQTNQPEYILNRWQQEGDVAPVQRYSQDIIGPVLDRYNRYIDSDAVIDDSSFIRLKTLSLSYSFPSEWLSRIRMQDAKLFIQGQNLFTITSFEGLDPETGVSLPPLRMVTVGIQVKL